MKTSSSLDLELRKDVTGFYDLFSKVPFCAYSAVPSLAGLAGGNPLLDPIVGKFFVALACKRLSKAISGRGKPKSIQMAGLGLGMTFIISFESAKLAVRVKNELRERQVHHFWEEQPAFLVENAATRFKREADTLTILSKKRLSPKPLDWDDEHICVEFVEGQSIFHLAKSGSLSKKHLELAFSAMDRMHSSGIIYADSNPANILVTKKNEIQLLDFEKAYNPNYIKSKDMPRVDLAMFIERFNQYAQSEFKEHIKLFSSALRSETECSFSDLIETMRKYPVIFRRGTDNLLEEIA
jgi:RIO-like serine/threonine protein kinase